MPTNQPKGGDAPCTVKPPQAEPAHAETRHADTAEGSSNRAEDRPIQSPAHNPDKLSPEQVGVADGWRLLDMDEVRLNEPCTPVRAELLNSWFRNDWETNGFSTGILLTLTYRTRLSRAELRKARGLPEEAPDRLANLHEVFRLKEAPIESGSDDASKPECPKCGAFLGRTGICPMCDTTPAPPTPRTDAATVRILPQYEGVVNWVPAKVCCKLERELFAALEAAAKALAELRLERQRRDDCAFRYREILIERDKSESERAARERAEKNMETMAGEWANDRKTQALHWNTQLAEAQQQRDALIRERTEARAERDVIISERDAALAELREAKEDSVRLDWLCDLSDKTRRVYRFGDKITAVSGNICHDKFTVRAAIDDARKES